MPSWYPLLTVLLQAFGAERGTANGQGLMYGAVWYCSRTAKQRVHNISLCGLLRAKAVYCRSASFVCMFHAIADVRSSTTRNIACTTTAHFNPNRAVLYDTLTPSVLPCLLPIIKVPVLAGCHQGMCMHHLPALCQHCADLAVASPCPDSSAASTKRCQPGSTD